MNRPKIRFFWVIAVLSISIIACNLTENFVNTENELPTGGEVIDPTSSVVGDSVAEPVGEGDAEPTPVVGDSPAIDVSARPEVFALLSQTIPPPDLSALPAEVINCLANDDLLWDGDKPAHVTIFDEYPSGQQKQVTCSLVNNLINGSNENIIIVYDNLSYVEKVDKPQNRRSIFVGEPVLPGGEIYLVRNFNHYPLDPAEGVSISTTIGFAAFYDRPECKVFIEDANLLPQVWVPLDYVCKDYLPTP